MLEEMTEIEAYKNRAEIKLSELLSEIRLAGRQLELQEKDLTSDQKMRMIANLEQQIMELAKKKREESKEEITQDIEQLKAYKARLEREYNEMLSYRPGIIKQTEEEEKELVRTTEKKLAILQDLWGNIADLENSIESLKREKADFIQDIEDREKAIKQKERELENRHEEVEVKVDDTADLKKEYLSLVNQASQEKESLEQKNKLTSKKNTELSDKIKAWEVKIESLTNKEIELENKRLSIIKEEEKLVKEKGQLSQQKEAVDKTMAQFGEREKSIEKDRGKLESQQETLKAAFIEARTKGIIK